MTKSIFSHFSLKRFCYLLLIVWLLVLSILIQNNMVATHQLADLTDKTALNTKIHSLEIQEFELNNQLYELQISLETLQSQLQKTTDTLDTHIKTLNDRLSSFVMHPEFILLKDAVQDLKNQIQKLQETKEGPAAHPIQQQTTDATSNKHIAQHIIKPPFEVLGIEWRGQIQVLSVLPNHTKNHNAIVLLSIGHSFKGWQLKSIHAQTATFKVGHQTRHLTIPTH